MPSDFAVTTHITGRTVMLAVIGELDLVSCPSLEQAIDESARADVDQIVVDLRGLEFMDSTGLHLLVRGRDQVQRLFDLTGVTESLTVVDSPDQLLEVDQAPGAP